MSKSDFSNAYGAVPEPLTFEIRRVLPGPIERVWAYLTESDLRRRWLAAGDMEPKVGAAFEFVWRNDELTDPPGRRPDGASAEHRLDCAVLAYDPPRRLVIRWGKNGEVSFELEPHGQMVLLRLVHRRVVDPDMLLRVGAGWHMHLDILAARLGGTDPEPFWDGWSRLRGEYEQRLGP